MCFSYLQYTMSSNAFIKTFLILIFKYLYLYAYISLYIFYFNRLHSNYLYISVYINYNSIYNLHFK